METLQESRSSSPLGLSDFRTRYQILTALPQKGTDISRPTVIVGDVDLTRLPLDQLAHVLHIQPLIEHQNIHAVVSGTIDEDARSLIASCASVAYAGPNPLFARYIASIERSTFALQTALTAEALQIGAALQLDRSILYSAIAGAAGSSWSFRNYAPCMLGNSTRDGQTMQQAFDALAATVRLVNAQSVPLPLTALAKQLFAAVPAGDKSKNSWEIANLPPPASAKASNGVHVEASSEPGKVGLIGLGAMGYGMANVLRASNISVVGYDTWAPSMERYTAAGGVCADTITACARDADVLVLMVVNAAQARAVLLDEGAALALPPNAVILLMCTVAPAQALALQQDLAAVRSDLHLVDAPVSGGTPRAASGDLTILCAGLDSAGPNAGRARFVLEAFSGRQGNADNLITVPGGVGKGAAVKVVNQLLAGSHIISVAETLAAAAALKLPLQIVRDVLLDGPAQSWMLGHRGQNMINRLLQPPTSMIDIFVKDMGIVTAEAATLSVPVPLAAQVEQLFIMGRGRGWGRDDDSRLWGEEIMAQA